VVLASGVYFANNRVTSGVSELGVDACASGDKEGDRDCLDGDGR
jgi:hypothetical protein